MTKAVKVAAVTAALVSIGAMTANATVTGGAGSDAPLAVSFPSTITDDGVGGAAANGGANWTVMIGYTPLAISPFTGVVTVFGQHMVNPHGPPELAPNPNVFSAAWLLPSGPQSYGASLSHQSAHNDVWSATLTPLTPPGPGFAQYTVGVTGQHIPEPHQYALMAGLGLLAFGAYRRTRS